MNRTECVLGQAITQSSAGGRSKLEEAVMQTSPTMPLLELSFIGRFHLQEAYWECETQDLHR